MPSSCTLVVLHVALYILYFFLALDLCLLTSYFSVCVLVLSFHTSNAPSLIISNARVGRDMWQFYLWWCGPFKIPSSKTLSLSCSKIICASTAFSLYGFPNTSDTTVNNAMGQDTNWQVQSQKEWNCAQTIVGWG